jgi:Holliday junction DNA helicase RuvB
MDNIIGHQNTKKQIRIAIQAAKTRNKAVPHMLLSGVAGCGKTTMAMELAKEGGVDFLAISPDDAADRESVLRILDKLSHDNYDKYGNRTGEICPTVVFFDEIHRMPRKGQEIMGIAMEKFQLETGKSNKFYWIPYFTIIGATTDDGELTKPFREKFKLRFLFDTYNKKEVTDIVKLHANKQQVIITDKAARAIAQRSRGIPREAVKYLGRARDYAMCHDAKVITSQAVEDNFKIIGVDSKGLTKVEIKILKTLYTSRDPVGLDNLAIITNESPKNIKNTVEPFLIQEGMIVRSGKGRVLTDQGRKHLEKDGYLGTMRDKIEIPATYVRS